METYGRERREQMPLPIDRLSELPDAILCHILSLLPTKASVATSILARRWRFLWAYVPKLHFDCEESRLIIDRVLVLHKLPSLKSFSIQLPEYECDENRMETWVNFAIDRNVQYLHLYVTCYNLLPSRLFISETLVDLRLCQCGTVPTLHGVCLPRLKNLWLMCVEFEDEESLPCLLSGSPVLENFRFRSYNGISLGSCNVSSPTVKWLCLEMLVPSLGPRELGHRLEINTPALEYLLVLDNVAGPIEFGGLPSLIAADIYNQDDGEEDAIIGCVSLLKCVDRLSNVKCLKLDLSFYTTIIKSVFSAWTPSFSNLTKLELTADCCFLSKFLENANNLEILEFHDETESQINSEHPLDELTTGWIEPQEVPKCLLSSLRTIKIVNTVGTKHGLEIIKYLLRNAKVLKRMDITYPSSIDSEEKNNLLQKISLFERGSTTCDIVFTEPYHGEPHTITVTAVTNRAKMKIVQQRDLLSIGREDMHRVGIFPKAPVNVHTPNATWFSPIRENVNFGSSSQTENLFAPMKIVAWNCRGSPSNDFVTNARNLISLHQPHIFIVTGTKFPAERAELITNGLYFDDKIVVLARNNGGGMWVLWNRSQVTLSQYQISYRSIHAMITLNQSVPRFMQPQHESDTSSTSNANNGHQGAQPGV